MVGSIPVGDIVVSSIVLGGAYILLGLSWVVIFRATRVLNVAVGQFMALGAYMSFTFLVTFHLPFPLAILLALTSVALFAGLTFHFFVRPLHGQPHFVVVVLSIGWSIVIGGASSLQSVPVQNLLPRPLRATLHAVL